MSPPIFNPDGPEVNEIVLPNGATASEVIDPDGNVVFEAAPDIPDSVAEITGSPASYTNNSEFGFQIKLFDDWPSIGVRLNAGVSGFGSGTAYLYDNDFTQITSKDISSLSAGDIFTFDSVNLVSGNKYIITMDNSGNDYYSPYLTTSFPVESEFVNITARVQDREIENNPVHNLDAVGHIGF